MSRLSPQEWVGSRGEAGTPPTPAQGPVPSLLWSFLATGSDLSAARPCGKQLGVALTISLVVIHPGLTWLAVRDLPCCPPEPAWLAPFGKQTPHFFRSVLPEAQGRACLAHSQNSEFIHSTNRYLLSTYRMPGTVLGAGDTE